MTTTDPLRETRLWRVGGNECRVVICREGECFVVGSHTLIGQDADPARAIYSPVAGYQKRIRNQDAADQAFDAYIKKMLAKEWIITNDSRDGASANVADLERLFGDKLTYTLRVGGGGQRAMRRLIAQINPPIAILADAKEVMSLPQGKTGTLVNADALEFPIVLHFAMAGILTVKRNGVALDDRALHAYLAASKPRAIGILIPLGRISPMTSHGYDFSAAIGGPSAVLSL